MWAPLVNVNHLRSVPVKREASVGQWPPVCSSCHWQARKTGTLILSTNVDRRQRVGDLRPVVVVAADLPLQVGGLAVERLVLGAGLVALLDPLPGPRLSVLRRGRQAVLDPVLRPFDREPGVEDAARVERRLRVVDQRDRRDRGEARRLGRRGEQLADAAVGDPHHPDLVALDPRLAGDRLDHVVAVEALQRLEEVEGAARATGAAHVDVDDGEAHQVADQRDAALGAVGIRVAVARRTRSASEWVRPGAPAPRRSAGRR